MELNRRKLAAGMAWLLIPLTAFGGTARLRLFSSTGPNPVFQPPRGKHAWSAARGELLGSEWRYERLQAGRGLVEHMKSGATFATSPRRRGEKSATLLPADAEQSDCLARPMGDAAAQVATWAEAMGE
jgi:hypothetical protein